MGTFQSNATAEDRNYNWEPLLMNKAAVVIWQIGIPLVVIIGTFGNIMIILIQGRVTDGHSSSMPVYFLSLAVSDMLSLWLNPLIWWMNALGFKLNASHDVLCKVRVYLAYLTGHTSAWILVAMTFQRSASILWPHRVNVLCNRHLATMVTCALFGFLALFNAHILYGQTMVTSDNETVAQCFFTFVNDEYKTFFNIVWGWIDTSVCAILPFVCLLLGNIVLVRTVGQSQTKAREHLAAGQSYQLNVRQRKVSSMTVTLISISVEFVFLTGPNSVYLMFIETFSRGADKDIGIAAANELALALTSILWFSNNAINFYIYCLTGTKCRKEFARLIPCCLKHRQFRSDCMSSQLSVIATEIHSSKKENNSRVFLE